MSDIEIALSQVEDGSIITPSGFHTTGLYSGVKKSRKDLAAIYCDKPASAAAVFTLNQIQAAPLKVTKESLVEEQRLQAVIINSGNANACTGEQGMKDAYEMRDLTAEHFHVAPRHVAVASTGVIGEAMPMDKIGPHIGALKVGQKEQDALHFGEAILTTDTFAKTTCWQAEIDGKIITMAGAAKGSGMIKPNMATMLSFLTTDAVIAPDILQKALKQAVDQTFNCITVDGDTSTNDTVLVMASELAGNETLTPAHPDWPVFFALLTKVTEELAKDVARDGEGATKLVEVEVNGAENQEAAIQVAKTVIGSSLVKTAIYGSDPNWGRIICAIGYSGVTIQPETIDMSIGSIPLLQQSEPVAFSEEEATGYLENEEIQITVDLNMGEATGKAWGCDLTYDYVRINASYRT